MSTFARQDSYVMSISKHISEVGLWSTFRIREGGLDAPPKSSSRFAGQQQLISFARTLIRKTKFLVLDEATSSVDSTTEEKIMQIIKDHQRPLH